MQDWNRSKEGEHGIMAPSENVIIKERYCGVNCSKCGRWVGKDGFYDYDPVEREIGYSLCARCLKERKPTRYELEKELRGH